MDQGNGIYLVMLIRPIATSDSGPQLFLEYLGA